MIIWVKLYSSMKLPLNIYTDLEYNICSFCRATIAQDYDRIWVGITSKTVEIVQSDEVASISALISSIIRSKASQIPDKLTSVRTEVFYPY